MITALFEIKKASVQERMREQYFSGGQLPACAISKLYPDSLNFRDFN
jgi:hypothetical protein